LAKRLWHGLLQRPATTFPPHVSFGSAALFLACIISRRLLRPPPRTLSV
jgi:hypothetical protein